MKRVLLTGIVVLAGVLCGCRKEPTLTTTSSDAARLYRDGVSQFDRFYYTEAKSLIDQALQHDSSFAMAWARLAILDLELRDDPSARSSVSRAVALSAAATEREQLFIRMWDHRIRYDMRAAAATADSFLAKYPDEREVYLFRGNLLEQDKNYDAAIKCYQRAVQIDTSYAIGYMSLGYAYSSIGEQEKAVAQMQHYIRLAPNEADPLASYADILMRAGKYEEAFAQYQLSLKVRPDYWYAIRETGRICLLRGQLRSAREYYRKAFALMPKSPATEYAPVHIDGVLEHARGHYKEAVALFEQVLRVDTANLDAAYSLANSLTRLDRFDEARRVMRQVFSELSRMELLASPNMAQYHVMQSVIAMRAGKQDEALAECDSAINFSLSLTRAGIYRQMAEVLFRKQLYEQALGACEDALILSPNAPDVFMTLVRVYHARGDEKMAQQIGARLLDFWRDADPDYVNKQDLQRLLGLAK